MAAEGLRKKTSGPGRLTAEEAALLPERILEAAQAVFVEKGYARATIEDIAKAAGASRKTIYARYSNKAEVLTAVVNRLLDSALETPMVEASTRPANDPRAQLLAIARSLASLSAAPQVAGLNRLILAEAYQIPELARLFVDLHERAIDAVRDALQDLRRDGLLTGLGDPRLAATIFVEMVASVPRMRALLGAPLSQRQRDALAAAAVELFLHGCRGDE